MSGKDGMVDVRRSRRWVGAIQSILQLSGTTDRLCKRLGPMAGALSMRRWREQD